MLFLSRAFHIFHLSCFKTFRSKDRSCAKLVVTMDGGMIGRKMKMILTENDFDQMTGILHCKSGKALQNSCA